MNFRRKAGRSFVVEWIYKGRIKMNKTEMPHPMHDEHLCYLVNMGFMESNFKDYAELVKDAKFVCKKCGRSADSEENLCRPQKI
jgi:hypothetical protein